MYKTTFRIDFVLKNPRSFSSTASLEAELPFVPTLESAFDHPVWENSRKPERVSYDLDAGTFYVYFGTVELENEEQAASVRQGYDAHDWDVFA